MALNQVGARTEGDVYQGLFFWKQAADLLRDGSMVERVVLEHDAADGVDDVAVFYADPGVNAGGWMASADYFQLKYHVDNRDAYSAAALIDPTFIKAKSSLLQRFHKAYSNLAGNHKGFRLHLASNWRWKDHDKLASLIREYDGALPPQFLTDGPRSDLGRIREQWREHLGIEVGEFSVFARTLRFQLDHFGRRDFKNYVYVTLNAVGLKTPSADRVACPYESLVQQFLMDGPNSFNRNSFRELCAREGLFRNGGPTTNHRPSLGIRSFIRFAERLDDEVGELLCVSSRFQGRHPRDSQSWSTGAAEILAFLGNEQRRSRLRTTETAVALECHGSFATLAGWELSRNSGALVFPVQKPSRDVWRPNIGQPDEHAEWIAETLDQNALATEIAVCLSVTHDIRSDVVDFLFTPKAPQVSKVVVLTPTGGASPQTIRGPDHAYALASQLPGHLRTIRPNRGTRVHLFFACPNALMFFIGQQREALGRLTLYEFDFGFERTGTYHASLSLPSVVSPAEASEVHDAPEG